MKYKTFILLAVLLAGDILAHGVQIESEMHYPCILVKVMYSGGKPIKFAAVKIISPDSARADFQNGRADANGIFSFVPDTPGEWQVSIDDEMGHRLQRKIIVKEDFFDEETKPLEATEVINNPQPVSSSETPTWFKLVWGLSVIFGITGLIYWYKARQLLRK